jgi:hypothetical protein
MARRQQKQVADDLIELTTLFWWDVIKSTPDHRGFSGFLSPYCRLQDEFGDNSRGVNGKLDCEMKLIEFKNHLFSARLDPKIRHIQLMNSPSQSSNQIRFFISDYLQMSSTETLLASIGIAIEWQNGFILGIVISRNIPQESFFHPKIVELASTIPPSLSETLSFPEEEYETIPSDGFFLGRSLNPPFLVPKPLMIPPTLSLVVISCHNLQSRLIRLFPRPIHCRITVRVGNMTQITPIIKNSSNPIFCSSPFTAVPFLFQIPPRSFLSGFVEMIIEDLFPFPANILAKVQIPYSILPFQEDTLASNDLFIRLSLLQPYLLTTASSPSSPSSSSSSPSLDASSPSPSSPSSSPSVTQETISRMCSIGDSPKIQKEIFTDLVPYLKIRASRVDVFQWWVMQELQARDRIREEQIAQLEKDADLSLSDEVSHASSRALDSDEKVGEQSEWERYKYESMRWITSKELW